MSTRSFTSVLTAALLFLGSASILRAQESIEESYQIDDSGQPREFAVAKDEIYLKKKKGHEGRFAKVTAQRSAEAIRKLAVEHEQTTDETAQLVVYELDQPRTEENRRIVTGHVLLHLAAGVGPETITAAFPGQPLDAIDFAPGYYRLAFDRPGSTLAAAKKLRSLPGVLSADPALAKMQAKRATPNDTYFPNQWHLKNTGQNGGTSNVDIDVVPVWDTYRGAGVGIGIVDDGLQATHPDLALNVDPQHGHDWNDDDDDPSPDLRYDTHGTSVAGVAAAVGFNGTGVSGVAPEATLIGLRLISGPTTDFDEADAFSFRNDIVDIKSNSWGPSDDGRTLEGPGPLAKAAFANAVQNGRGGLGTVFVWAGGNGLGSGDNSNNDGYANSIYTIAVGAVSDRGTQTDYAEPGADLVVSAPSDSLYRQGIVTTDLVGNFGYNYFGARNFFTLPSAEVTNRDYTNSFGGTSSATPVVSGVVALMLDANPNLGWRDVQEILIRSAAKNNPSDPDWSNNGAGFHFNHKYGAGLVDAMGAVNLAINWTNLPAQTSTQMSNAFAAQIPDNSAAGLVRTFTFSGTPIRVEQATVTVNISHKTRSDLAIDLISPAGTVSHLAETGGGKGKNFTNWTFSTVRNWGEMSTGAWTLRVADRKQKKAGTLSSCTVTLYGAP